ncbi:hypothetical protein PTTG_31189, partial [Puccinia triticina 1-1 BBBD Race 1]
MNAAQINKLSLKELIALDAKIKSAIATARVRERANVQRRMAELAESHGFSLSEFFGRGHGSKARGVAKYANPADRSQTWTGRGRKPNWVIA